MAQSMELHFPEVITYIGLHVGLCRSANTGFKLRCWNGLFGTMERAR